MAKRHKRGRSEYAKRKVNIAHLEADVRNAAQQRGLTLMVSVVTGGRSGKSRFPHWMFDREEGGRVLNYWPTKGTWWAPKTNERGNTLDPFEALDIASRVSVQPKSMLDPDFTPSPLLDHPASQPTLF